MPRISAQQIKQEQFYQMPKWLFEGRFTKMSNDARVMYSLLKDRFELSMKNEWIDDEGNVYLVFTIENLMEMLNCSKMSVTKYKKELKNFELIEDVRKGLNKPNWIYLCQPNLESRGSTKNGLPEVQKMDVKKSNKLTSRGTKNVPELTDNSNTNLIKTEDSKYVNRKVDKISDKQLNKAFIDYSSQGIGKRLFWRIYEEYEKNITKTQVKYHNAYFRKMLEEVSKRINGVDVNEKDIPEWAKHDWLNKELDEMGVF